MIIKNVLRQSTNMKFNRVRTLFLIKEQHLLTLKDLLEME